MSARKKVWCPPDAVPAKMTYQQKDAMDYFVMLGMSAAASHVSLRPVFGSSLHNLVLGCCAFLALSFVKRHGFELVVPTPWGNPVAFMKLVFNRLSTLPPVIMMRGGLAVAEHMFATRYDSSWHYSAAMDKLGMGLILVHFTFLTAFRTYALVDHLRKLDLCRTRLMETNWRKELDHAPLPVLILHAYVTGIFSHCLALVPWTMRILYMQQSLMFMPISLISDVATLLLVGETSPNGDVEIPKDADGKQNWIAKLVMAMNWSFYERHKEGHQSRMGFNYLHGMHHDGLPSALIAIGEAGALEGMINCVDIPGESCFHSHLFLASEATKKVLKNMIMHQYIPGVFPYVRCVIQVDQHHSEHHYLSMKPLSMGMNLKLKEVDGELNLLQLEGPNYNTDNDTWNGLVAATAKYEDSSRPSGWWEKWATSEFTNPITDETQFNFMDKLSKKVH